MYCRFESRARQRPPIPSPGAPAPWSPLGRLLASLRGREVSLLAGGREQAGRVVAVDGRCVTLAARNGRICVALLAKVASVQF